ncbi:MAG: threonine ammonia-lyase [Tepidisphaeraceae bacterium]
MTVTLDDIVEARQRIRPHVYHSPCPPSNYLSAYIGASVYSKLENLQTTGSFKARGACNRLMQLSAEEKRRGVICVSAGNHAQGVAYHGRALGIPVTVVMPKWAPLVKVSNCRGFGADVILHGEHFGEARTLAMSLAEERNLVFVPPFNHPQIIAGAGTIGLEILEDVPDVEAIIVPVGGGGLIAGITTAVKSLRPDVLIYGAESISATSLDASLKAGHVTTVQTQPTLADGLAVPEVGPLCFDLVKDRIEGVVLVDESQIASAILRLLEVEKTVAEGAGAISLAAAYQIRDRLAGKKVVIVLCGGNIDVTVLSRIIDRGLRVDGRLCRILVTVTDRPGGLAALLNVIATTGASIKEVMHDRHFGPSDVARVRVMCTLETQGFDHIDRMLVAIKNGGFDVEIDA